MTTAEALRHAAARIGGATARLDAELLLAHALGCTRDALILRPPSRVDVDAYARLVERRAAGEPVAYITATREFWSLPLRVTPAVLIPRPDSETLVSAALDALRERAVGRVLDLGTGSGALLLATLSEWRGAFGIGVDRSAAAVAVARGNAEALGLAERAAFVVGDWAEAVGGRFDLVLCNPPYVAPGAAASDVDMWEPHAALYGGADGLDAYRRVVPALPSLLADGGVAAVEIGPTQADAVTALAPGLVTDTHRDLAGHPRALVFRRGGASPSPLR